MASPPTREPNFRIELDPPKRVSPFIRFCRWSLLFAGVWYGASHYRTLKKREDAERAYIAKMKPTWMEHKKKILDGRQREELLYLNKEAGVELPKDFDQLYPPYTGPPTPFLPYKEGKH